MLLMTQGKKQSKIVQYCYTAGSYFLAVYEIIPRLGFDEIVINCMYIARIKSRP